MQFESFEQALLVCMQASDNSEEQKAAMTFCLEHAPADLRSMLEKRLKAAEEHQQSCGCGCGSHD